MSYFNEAFEGFAPHLDKDAAVKFALNMILTDSRLDELAMLLTDGHEVGGVEGVPGWIIERRDSGPSGETSYYAGWPPGVSFRAYVDPDSYELTHPELFLGEAAFHRYVRAGITAYAVANPEKALLADEALSKLKQ